MKLSYFLVGVLFLNIGAIFGINILNWNPNVYDGGLVSISLLIAPPSLAIGIVAIFKGLLSK
jgi:hypothetical protein